MNIEISGMALPIRRIEPSALTLLATWVRLADDIEHAPAFDDLAVWTDFLYTCSDFHFLPDLSER